MTPSSLPGKSLASNLGVFASAARCFLVSFEDSDDTIIPVPAFKPFSASLASGTAVHWAWTSPPAVPMGTTVASRGRVAEPLIWAWANKAAALS